MGCLARASIPALGRTVPKRARREGIGFLLPFSECKKNVLSTFDVIPRLRYAIVVRLDAIVLPCLETVSPNLLGPNENLPFSNVNQWPLMYLSKVSAFHQSFLQRICTPSAKDYPVRSTLTTVVDGR